MVRHKTHMLRKMILENNKLEFERNRYAKLSQTLGINKNNYKQVLLKNLLKVNILENLFKEMNMQQKVLIIF